MGWFSRKTDKSSAGIAWTLGAEDVLTYKADCRMEDHQERWTPQLSSLMDSSNKGFRTNTGGNPVAWASHSVDDLELDSHRRRALLAAVVMPGHDPETTDGRAYRDTPGFRQLPWRGYSISGFSVSPDGSRVAVLEFRGGADGVLSVTDIVTGARVEVTSVEHVSGNETPQWSSDGKWILLSTHPALLVDVDGRRQMTFSGSDNPNLTAVDWWPKRGGSIIFMLSGSEGRFQVREFDLSTGTHTTISEVRLPTQPDLALWRHIMAYPKVSPVDNTVLVGISLGPPGAYQEQHGGRYRMAMLEAGTGEVRQLFEPFVDGTPVERVHDDWRWNRVAIDPRPVTMAASVAGQLTACPVPPTFTNDDPQDTTLWLWTAG